MIVRKIRKEDFKRTEQLSALAFEFGMQNSDLSPDAYWERFQQEPDSLFKSCWDQTWAAFEDDDQTMMSKISVLSYQVQFDGHSANMAGIGGVASLPQYRRSGGVRACFEKALPDMYERGMVFSYLYPFSTVFYRKFGYELGCERILHQIKLSGAPAFEVSGTFHLLESSSDLKTDIRTVYERLQSRYNMMTVDPDWDYEWVDKADPFRDKEYTWLYRSADGTPKAVVTYKPSADEGDRDLRFPTLDCTKRFWFYDAEGFSALIQLLKRFAADHSHISFYLPLDVELGALMPEWSFGTVKRHQFLYGMVRVVNVEQALQMAKMRGSGELIIEVSDPQISQNNARFAVRFAPGEANAVKRTDAPADVRLSIQDFSRLICGRYDIDQWQWLPGVELLCEAEKAAKVFYRKPLYITRYF